MRIALGVAVMLALTGPCWAQAVQVVVPPPITVGALPAGLKTKPVSLTRIAANIAPGTPWADEAIISAPVPMPCALDRGVQVTRWKEANNRIELTDTWDRVFRQELGAAGFAAGGDPTNLFEQQQSGDLQVGALITDLRLQSCFQSTIAGDTLGGSAVMSVEWQVFSVAEGRVVARISTRGGTILKASKNAAALTLITGAFGDNVKRLAAEPQFREIVTAAAAGPPAAPASAPLRFAPASGVVPIATAVKSVVSIYGGDGMGSGVVISPDGYILTNHHVAGDRGQVRVRWSNGTETVGEVIRADRKRDVALIKAEAKASALPIRDAPALLGETVFAVGTPLRREFANTLTRGVVSATRVVEGQTLIQSDVAVDHGNSGGPLLDEKGQIIALTVSGYTEDGVGRNINFFIPIDDALKALALTPAP